MHTPAWAQPSNLAALREQAAAWWAAHEPALLVEVAATQGSTPREVGARMVVTARAEAGTVGGGHLEYLAVATAREALATSPGALPSFERRFALGPSLGQCCGGVVTLRFSLLDEPSLLDWPRPPDALAGTLRLDAAATNNAIHHPIQLHGAGHVGRAIVVGLANARVQWVDERGSAYPNAPAWFAAHPHVEQLHTDSAVGEVASAAPGTVFLVMTHSHELDWRLVHAILQRGDAAFCGLIGSRTKRASFMRRLAERGVPADQLDRLVCPIGLPPPVDWAPYAKQPEVIAAGVLRQLRALTEPATARREEPLTEPARG